MSEGRRTRALRSQPLSLILNLWCSTVLSLSLTPDLWLKHLTSTLMRRWTMRQKVRQVSGNLQTGLFLQLQTKAQTVVASWTFPRSEGWWKISILIQGSTQLHPNLSSVQIGVEAFYDRIGLIQVLFLSMMRKKNKTRWSWCQLNGIPKVGSTWEGARSKIQRRSTETFTAITNTQRSFNSKILLPKLTKVPIKVNSAFQSLRSIRLTRIQTRKRLKLWGSWNTLLLSSQLQKISYS